MFWTLSLETIYVKVVACHYRKLPSCANIHVCFLSLWHPFPKLFQVLAFGNPFHTFLFGFPLFYGFGKKSLCNCCSRPLLTIEQCFQLDFWPTWRDTRVHKVTSFPSSLVLPLSNAVDTVLWVGFQCTYPHPFTLGGRERTWWFSLDGSTWQTLATAAFRD